MVQAALDNNMADAKEIDDSLQEFFEQEFIQTNPLPIKTALAHV